MVDVTLISAVALAASALAAPTSDASDAKRIPIVYLAGDSTMAPGGGGNGTEGWGQYLHYSLNIPVVNLAIAGRSVRSYAQEGSFANITNLVKKGDFVIIEFSHNDGTSSPDNGRSDCPGTSDMGEQVCHYIYNGVNETVYTFNTYLNWAQGNITSKGGHVIFSSQTPNNPWETGTFVYAPPRFVSYAYLAANQTGRKYADHNNYTYDVYRKLSPALVNSWFPMDHTHTSPQGAALVAQTFVRSLVCKRNGLRRHVVNSTESIEGECIKGDP